MNYIHRVENILYFVEVSRNSDLVLNLKVGESLSKVFFAMYRENTSVSGHGTSQIRMR
ncbi:hypothetical protein HOLleu_03610 [Holothuria leucospilota]|uniref:Uncharacterized protein n=1 Tax=Holothuria leucospilota TaxID=206669 RepID=A0A9Q1HHQ2_HOLLE|nr:hypothetical protein HOLleu_03610 [Holothuria leucospilota]